ncbi:cupredoxin domain-containing protein [Nevskia sp.]|uniref:cupredoxin domain-containing protein n=1 Tax=Nevskia sp. TaxID=1929292 RepID=UPI0025E3041E|nr:cupredoxin domain-containing protein [Nevskia sp.]
MKRSIQPVAAGLLVAAAGAFGFTAGWASDPPVQKIRMVKVSSKRYEFIPAQLTLKKGETVDIELSTEDIVMGFSAPELKLRATMVPGQVSHLRLTPQEVGRFDFLCDVFCGAGHEDMNGAITVVE